MTSMSAREFNQDISAAKRAARHEPVIVTDRGTPAYVLLSIEEYRRLADPDRSIADWLALDEDVDFEAARLNLQLQIPEL